MDCLWVQTLHGPQVGSQGPQGRFSLLGTDRYGVWPHIGDWEVHQRAVEDEVHPWGCKNILH